jgi:hypothetical protein
MAPKIEIESGWQPDTSRAAAKGTQVAADLVAKRVRQPTLIIPQISVRRLILLLKPAFLEAISGKVHCTSELLGGCEHQSWL